MVFSSIDKQSQPIIATILNGQITEKYDCSISVCANPVCTCRNVNLHLTPIDGEGDKVSVSLPRYLEIDLVSKKLKDKKKLPKEDLLFAETFLRNLTEDDFTELFKIHFLIKNRITEEARADSIDAHFDYEKIERDGLMEIYTDVLPFTDRLYVEIDGKKCILFDQYCVKSKCDCREAMLDIAYVDEVSGKGNELCHVLVDYRKKLWKLHEDTPSPVALNTLQTTVEMQIPDIYATLLKRHDRLKAIYAFCRKKHFAIKQPLILPKVGRNDPCPCGSGKKFKKCCADNST